MRCGDVTEKGSDIRDVTDEVTHIGDVNEEGSDTGHVKILGVGTAEMFADSFTPIVLGKRTL